MLSGESRKESFSRNFAAGVSSLLVPFLFLFSPPPSFFAPDCQFFTRAAFALLEIPGKIGAAAKNSSLDWLKVSERGGGRKERFLQGCNCNESFLSSARPFYGMFGNLLIRLFILGQGAEINLCPHYFFHWKSVFGNVHGGGGGKKQEQRFSGKRICKANKTTLSSSSSSLPLSPTFLPRSPLLFFAGKGEKNLPLSLSSPSTTTFPL